MHNLKKKISVVVEFTVLDPLLVIYMTVKLRRD